MLLTALAPAVGEASKPLIDRRLAALGADSLLARVVIRGLVDYDRLEAERPALDAALAVARTLDLRDLLRDERGWERLAFFINV
ncbi:MAG TPA: hypothetical protein VFM17_02685, partial [Candidatus Eisenbacteria bacterium]|nr:hypothetical protein [Candidatus Eisenbacteria bacterium]